MGAFWRKTGEGASERLAEADIDLDRRIGGAPPQRRRDIETHRPERGIIAQSKPWTIEDLLVELRHRVGVVAAGIEKRHDADRLRELYARLQAQFKARPSADRVVVGIERPGHLIAVSPHRTAAADVDPLVGREFGQRGALDRREGGKRRDNIAVAAAESPIDAPGYP